MTLLRWFPMVLLLGSCFPVVPGTVRIPQAQVLNTRVEHSGPELQFTVQVQWNNPNGHPVTLSKMQGQWILDGKPTHPLTLADVTLPAGGSLNVTVETRVPRPADWKSERLHTYRFDGGYHLQGQSSGGPIQAYTVFQGNFRE